jgi:hypothetical protein
MFRLSVLLSLLATLPVAAQANTVISLENINCSGTLSISSLAGASLSCAGNFDLSDGFIESDSQIFILAEGDLLLENLNINAPDISISTLGGSLQLANTVNIKATQTEGNVGGKVMISVLPTKQDIHWNNFNIGLNSGANIQISAPPSLTGPGEIYVMNRNGIVFLNTNALNFTTTGFITINTPISISSVPEANVSAMLLLGFGLLMLRRRSL